MTILRTPPVESIAVNTTNIEVEALSINANANKLRQTIAGIWDLDVTSSAEAPQKASFFQHKNAAEESVLGGDDERVLVPEQALLPGGKYRSILKLFIRYEHMPQAYAHGTAWLIRPDLAVTAGHNLFDWKYTAGRAVEIKAYAGYYGRASITDPKYQVEFRKGKRCVTTERWLSTRGSKPYDVGFIKFDKPFTNIVPMKYADTPSTGDEALGVVGYPADLKDAHTMERGSHMYEMFLGTRWNLATQADVMLAYHIDTEGGNSGAPVLRQSDHVAIGAHVYGGDMNTASVIGPLGNPYEDYIAAVDITLSKPGLNLVAINGNIANPAAPVATETSIKPTKAQPEAPPTPAEPVTVKSPGDAEGWLDILNKALSVTSDVIETAGPFMGPIGTPISAIAPIAIKQVQRALSQAENAGLETIELDAVTTEAVIERAILAEAALAALLDKHPDALKPSVDGKEEGLFDLLGDIGNIVSKAATVAVTNLAAPALNPVISSGLVLTAISQKLGAAKSEVSIESNGDLSESSPEVEFMTELQKALEEQEKETQNGTGDEEAFFTRLINIGKKTGELVSDAAKLTEQQFKEASKHLPAVAGHIAGGIKYAHGKLDQAGDWVDEKNPLNDIFGVKMGDLVFKKGAGGSLQDFERAFELASQLKVESAVEDMKGNASEEAMFERLVESVSKAFIIRALVADAVLTQVMRKPALAKEEGFFFERIIEKLRGRRPHRFGSQRSQEEGFFIDVISTGWKAGQIGGHVLGELGKKASHAF